MARPRKETFTLITFFDINNVVVNEFGSIAEALDDAKATLKAQDPDPLSFHLVAGKLIPLAINRDPTVEIVAEAKTRKPRAKARPTSRHRR